MRFFNVANDGGVVAFFVAVFANVHFDFPFL